MNVTQFAVMRAVERHENEPLSRVADDLVMERTSLYRALAVLERNNWIKLKSGRDNRSRCASISGLGWKALDRAQPDWARTQLAIVEKFGRDRWAHLVAEMQRLSQYAAELEPGMAKREAK
jgi:DNA-binding MarR family transcriptional regulator